MCLVIVYTIFHLLRKTKVFSDWLFIGGNFWRSNWQCFTNYYLLPILLRNLIFSPVALGWWSFVQNFIFPGQKLFVWLAVTNWTCLSGVTIVQRKLTEVKNGMNQIGLPLSYSCWECKKNLFFLLLVRGRKIPAAQQHLDFSVIAKNWQDLLI